jgi:hypothetical protein
MNPFFCYSNLLLFIVSVFPCLGQGKRSSLKIEGFLFLKTFLFVLPSL